MVGAINCKRDGWTRVAFGDVVANGRSSSKDPARDGLSKVVGLDHLEPGSLRLSAWDELSELPDGTSFSRVFRSGEVLFGKRRAYQRKVAVPDFGGICSGDLLVFSSKDESKLMPEFLPCLVQSEGFFDYALSTSAGSLSPRTSWKGLSKYEFDLPPLHEQRRIVDVVRSAQLALEAAREARRAVSTVIAVTRDQLAVQSSSELVSLSEICSVERGLSWKKEQECSSEQHGAKPVIGIKNVQREGLILRDLVHLRGVSDAAARKATLTGTSVLMVGSNGNADRVGNVYAATPETHGYLFASFLVCVTPNDEGNAQYVAEVLKSPSVQKAITLGTAGSTGLSNIRLSWLRDFRIPKPGSVGQDLLLDRVRGLSALAEHLALSERKLSSMRAATSDFLLRPERDEADR